MELFVACECGRNLLTRLAPYAPSAALDRLLTGTGLVWRETRPGVIFLGAADAATDEVTLLEDPFARTGGMVGERTDGMEGGEEEDRGAETAFDATAAWHASPGVWPLGDGDGDVDWCL